MKKKIQKQKLKKKKWKKKYGWEYEKQMLIPLPVIYLRLKFCNDYVSVLFFSFFLFNQSSNDFVMIFGSPNKTGPLSFTPFFLVFGHGSVAQEISLQNSSHNCNIQQNANTNQATESIAQSLSKGEDELSSRRSHTLARCPLSLLPRRLIGIMLSEH